MSLMEPIAQPDSRWRKAEDLSLIFRGAFIERYGHGEIAISEALLQLRAAKDVPTVPLPHLAGQRAAALQKGLTSLSARSKHVPAILKVLEEFSRFERLRGFLCHGAVSPLLDREGQWSLGIKLLDFRGSAPIRESMFLTKTDAAAVLVDLGAVVARLHAALGQIKGILATPAVITAAQVAQKSPPNSASPSHSGS